jgi:DNA-binding transcriptional ArsR family regulator
MTKREMFEMTINILAETTAPEKDELIEKLHHEIELLDHKRSTPRGMTKTQKENEIIMTNILDALVDIGEPTTVTDLIAHGIEGFELTNQKVSALLRKLVEKGKVTKTIEGKKARFAIA